MSRNEGRRDEKTGRSTAEEAARRRYRSPRVVSLTAAEVLEILGPAQGYGGTGRSGSAATMPGPLVGGKKI